MANYLKFGEVVEYKNYTIMADQIEGPLGLWTFPLLNALVQANNQSDSNDGVIETAKVIRDSNGEVQEVVVIKE